MGNVTDSSGAKKGHSHFKCARDDKGGLTLRIRATSGYSFTGILCPESLHRPVTRAGIDNSLDGD
eukprot:7342409-Pyramimonas_sp.AAC.1